MTLFDLFTYFVLALTLCGYGFLVWLILHGRAARRRMDAEFAARREEEGH
jgi:hypothetical protein